MSITYSKIVADTNQLTFLKILALWRGSIYKTIYAELLILFIIHLSIGCGFYFIFTPEKSPMVNKFIKTVFSNMNDGKGIVPITFVLGFYLSLVLARWYDEISIVPWLDKLAFLIATYVSSDSLNARYLRRTMIRYLNACYVLAAREYLYDIYQQFPDRQHIIKSGLLTEEEWAKVQRVFCKYSHYYVPCNWAMNLACKAREKEWITTDRELDKLIMEMANFRGQVATFYIVDFINPPLAYTQIVGFTVYCYLYVNMISSINLNIKMEDNPSIVEILLGIFPPIQFLLYTFYLGWYKTAECLLNPFGKTDFNFDAIYAVQRNLQAGFLIVDTYYQKAPPMEIEPHADMFLPMQAQDDSQAVTFDPTNMEFILGVDDD